MDSSTTYCNVGDSVGEKEGLRSFSILHTSVPVCGKIFVKQTQKSKLEVV